MEYYKLPQNNNNIILKIVGSKINVRVVLNTFEKTLMTLSVGIVITNFKELSKRFNKTLKGLLLLYNFLENMFNNNTIDFNITTTHQFVFYISGFNFNLLKSKERLSKMSEKLSQKHSTMYFLISLKNSFAVTKIKKKK